MSSTGNNYSVNIHAEPSSATNSPGVTLSACYSQCTWQTEMWNCWQTNSGTRDFKYIYIYVCTLSSLFLMGRASSKVWHRLVNAIIYTYILAYDYCVWHHCTYVICLKIEWRGWICLKKVHVSNNSSPSKQRSLLTWCREKVTESDLDVATILNGLFRWTRVIQIDGNHGWSCS